MSSALQVKSCKALVAHTEEDLVEAMQRDKKELRDKIESEASDVKRKMELECNEMRDRLQSEKKAASVAMEEEVEERKRDINQIRQTVSKEWGGVCIPTCPLREQLEKSHWSQPSIPFQLLK